MKYVRYIAIAYLLYLLVTSIYSYAFPDLSGTDGAALPPPDTVVFFVRTQQLPWLALIGLILLGWIFYFQRRVACSAAWASIFFLAGIVWKDLVNVPRAWQQDMDAIDYLSSYRMIWLAVISFILAVTILLPIRRKAEQVAGPDR